MIAEFLQWAHLKLHRGHYAVNRWRFYSNRTDEVVRGCSCGMVF